MDRQGDLGVLGELAIRVVATGPRFGSGRLRPEKGLRKTNILDEEVSSALSQAVKEASNTSPIHLRMPLFSRLPGTLPDVEVGQGHGSEVRFGQAPALAFFVGFLGVRIDELNGGE